jgi:Phage integrase family/Phage integrase, N-terminal SAM-like domain
VGAARHQARRALTFGEYANDWLDNRPLKERTRAHYTAILSNHLLPAFSEAKLKAITPDSVRRWHTAMGTRRPTMRAHTYALLRTVLGSAVQDQLIPLNPCHNQRGRELQAGAPTEAGDTAGAGGDHCGDAPEVPAHGAAGGAVCPALRWTPGIRRSDIDLKTGIIQIRRAVARADGQVIVATPKSDAGNRNVAIPPHLLPMVKEHLGNNISGGKDGLLFPAADGKSHLAPSTLYETFYKAREAAERPDLRFHDLRHTGAVLAASTGATLAELMSRLGHSTAGAALRYQHAVQERDMESPAL